MKHSKDNRRHKRTFFSPADNIGALLVFLDQEPINGLVLDISESGIGLTVTREQASFIEIGKKFFLGQINGISSIQLNSAVEIEVRWVLDHEFLGHIALGCQFHGMPESIQEEIRLIVG